MTVLLYIGVNLSDKAFDKDRDQVMERAIAAGVETMILTGTSLAESEKVLALANQYAQHCFCTAGMHPHDAKSFGCSSLGTTLWPRKSGG